MKIIKSFEYCFLLMLFLPLCSYSKSGNEISPLDYGYKEAKTDIDRFWVLYNTHLEAKKDNSPISYEGIDTIDIEIPQNAIPIPLTDRTNFCGVVIRVKNYSKDIFLYELSLPNRPVRVDPKEVDSGKFHQDQLQKGNFILSLKDKTPWVKRRIGYDYGHVRRDLVLIHNGKAKYKPVSPYNNQQSEIEATYSSVTKDRKYIENLKFYRKEHNQKKVYFLKLDYQYNVEIRNIELHTPQDTLVDDRLFFISNSHKILFKDVWVDGSYSRKDHSGYGIQLENVNDVTFVRLKGHANWGIFGNNNVNGALLKECDINRFDIHCYGKDICFVDCKFRNLYNSFTSIYGKISYSKCEFYDFTPFLLGASYNAYTKFDLIFNNCTIHAPKTKNYLIYAPKLTGSETTERPELSKQEYPSLYIKGLDIYTEDRSVPYYIYLFERKKIQWPKDSIPGIRQIKGVRFIPDSRQELLESNLQTLFCYPWSEYVKTAVIGTIVLAGLGVSVAYVKGHKDKG